MTEITDKVVELETTQKELETKQAELEKVKAETADYESKKNALALEVDRVRKDIDTAKEERRHKDSSFQEKLRNENLATARDKFFGEYGIKEPSEQAKYLEAFKKFDSGAVSSESIYTDLESTYVQIHAKELLGMKKTVEGLSKSSDEFKASLSSSGFAGKGFENKTETEGLDDIDLQAAKYAGIPLPEYQRLKKEGKIY